MLRGSGRERTTKMTNVEVEASGEQNIRKAMLASLLASLLYGSQYVVIKEGIDGYSPFFYGSITMGIGGVIALLYVLYKGPFPAHIFRRWEVWAGILLATMMISFQYVGLTLSTASIGGLIVGSNVIFVAPISAILFKEALGRVRTIGVILGLIGLITVTTNWNFSQLRSGEFLGYALLFGASLSIALTYPVARYALRHMEFYHWVMAFQLVSPIVLLTIAMLTGGPGHGRSSDLIFLAYVGLFCTAVPSMLWASGLRTLSPTTSATIRIVRILVRCDLGDNRSGRTDQLRSDDRDHHGVLSDPACSSDRWPRSKKEVKEEIEEIIDPIKQTNITSSYLSSCRQLSWNLLV